MTDISTFIHQIADWALNETAITAVALVGSYARETAREESDVDLILLCNTPETYLRDIGWVERFGHPLRHEIEEWGKVTSVRVWYTGGMEVEYGVASGEWASDPADEGDAMVIADGIKILYEKESFLTSRLAAFGT